MSFHVQKWPDISNDWSDIPSIKVGAKNDGKNRKKRMKKKERRKVNLIKQKERKREGRGGEKKIE